MLPGDPTDLSGASALPGADFSLQDPEPQLPGPHTPGPGVQEAPLGKLNFLILLLAVLGGGLFLVPDQVGSQERFLPRGHSRQSVTGFPGEGTMAVSGMSPHRVKGPNRPCILLPCVFKVLSANGA